MVSRVGKILSETIDEILDEWLRNSSETKLRAFHNAAFIYYDIGIGVDIFTIGYLINMIIRYSPGRNPNSH